MVLAGTCLWGRRWLSALLAAGPGKGEKGRDSSYAKASSRSCSGLHLVYLLLTESKQSEVKYLTIK